MGGLFQKPQKAPKPDEKPEIEEDDDDERRRRAREIASRGRKSTILTSGGPQEAVVSRASLLGG